VSHARASGVLTFRPWIVSLCIVGMAQFAVGQSANSVAQSPPMAIHSGTLAADIEQVLWWLPEEAEAVVVSRGSVPTTVLQDFSPIVGGATRRTYMYPVRRYEFQDLVAMNCIEPLVYNTGICQGELRDEMVNSLYGPKTASLFVKAVWWEKNETRATCDIVVFRDNTAARIIKAFTSLPHVPRDFNGVRGLEIDLNSGVSPEEYERQNGRKLESDWRYLAAPRADVYVATTGRALMNLIVERMKRHGANRALPADLPEWRRLDASLPAWGLRHYHAAIASRDPTSMLKRDPNAKGLVFFGGNTPSPFLCLLYLSKSDDAGIRFLRLKADHLNIEDSSRPKAMQRLDADCFEARETIRDSQDSERGCTAEAAFYSVGFLHLPLLGFAWWGEPLKSQ
jgi:hypothetical protein